VNRLHVLKILVLALALVSLVGASPLLAVCGDGVVDGAEQCDLGAGNGTDTTCCKIDCNFLSGPTPCRILGNNCAITTTCSGSDGECILTDSNPLCDCPSDEGSSNGANEDCPIGGDRDEVGLQLMN